MLKRFWDRVTFRHRALDEETRVGLHGGARATLWDRPVRGPYDDHARDVAEASVEYHVPGRRLGVGFTISPDMERALGVHLCTPLADLYAGLEGRALGRAAQVVIDRLNDLEPAYGRYEGRRTSLDVHDWAVWWHLWYPADSATVKDPWWRSGSWHPLGHLMYRRTKVKDPVGIRLPRIADDPVVTGTAREERWEMYFSKLPRVVLKRGRSWDIKLSRGYRGAWGSGGGHATSLARAVGNLVGSVLEREGGLVWEPVDISGEAASEPS